jgi:hypothetical protein
LSNKPRSEYRAVLYDDRESPARYVYPERPALDNMEAMVDVLEHHVTSGYAIGGHIEELLRLAGREAEYIVCLRAEEL